MTTPTASLHAELSAAKAELARCQQTNDRLRAENTALSDHVRTLVTYEADAKLEQRKIEFPGQPCWRCQHSAKQPDDNCGCCGNGHLGFPEADPED